MIWKLLCFICNICRVLSCLIKPLIMIRKFAAVQIILLLFSQSSNAQFYIAGGYHVGFQDIDSLNFVIDRYNSTRAWLDEQMDEIKTTTGLTFSMGIAGYGLMSDITWVGRKQTTSAKGTAPGTGQIVQRDLLYKLNSFNVGAGFIFGQHTKMGFGLSTDFGSLKVLTRVGDPATIDEMDYESVLSEMNILTSIFAQIMLGNMARGGFGLMLRPYYQLPWFLTNFNALNETINAFTASADPYYIRSRPSSFGIQIMLMLHSGE